MNRILPCVLLSAVLSGAASSHAAEGDSLFTKDNLVAWCIVPFDAKKRGPEERAAMLEKLGLHKFVYDYRAEHIPTFDAEMEALNRHHIELLGWWFPTTLNNEARQILDVIKRHNMTKCDLWVMGGGEPTKTPEEQAQRVEAEATRLKPIALEAARLGVRVGLYNHGNWFGEPENQIEIIERLKKDGVTNVGIVYNLHHGHEHMARLPVLLQKMKPYLICLNINGMGAVKDKILPLGAGDNDLSWLKLIRDSGYSGPIGILNHTDEDAEARLQDNMDGLAWLAKQLDGAPAGPKPDWRSFK
jgi:sugar phosphate isomerase/epimerase